MNVGIREAEGRFSRFFRIIERSDTQNTNAKMSDLSVIFAL